MKVTYNWLKEFVEIKMSPKALAEKLTMAGLEVTSTEEFYGDHIFEIEVTSNRPDCLSVMGIAREIAAISGERLKLASQKNPRLPIRVAAHLTIKIQDKRDCPLYTARIIRDIQVAPSPDWLKKRLESMGCRSVNNIVDITNYVLFETGEPLHAFDLDRLKGDAIFVRRAKAGEKIATIDGEERALGTDILVIAEGGRPVALAGIMGGKDTEVSFATKNILLEAAAFNPLIVRRGRRILAVQSESSYRFERGVNLEAVESASLKAAELIRSLAGGSCVLAKRAGIITNKRRVIALELSVVNKTLGINMAAPKIKKILNGLEFKAKAQTKNRFVTEVPGHRPDVNSEVDLIEEIARIYGYENIPETQAAVKPEISGTETREKVSLIKNILVGLGLNEVITYSLTDKDLLRDVGMHNGLEAIEVLNPLSREQGILRPNLVPSLAVCVARNLNQKQEYVNIFEVAKAFSHAEASTREELNLSIAICGTRSLLLEGGLIKEPASILHLKGILEVLFGRLGVRDYAFNTGHGLNAVTVTVKGEKIGLLTKLDKSALDKLEIKNKDVFTLELSLERLLLYANPAKKFQHLPLYPGIYRDISLILKEDVSAGAILKAIEEKGKPFLEEARISDYYKGKQIPTGFKGLTVSCLYRSQERTLTEAEINPVHSLVCGLLTERFGVSFR